MTRLATALLAALAVLPALAATASPAAAAPAPVQVEAEAVASPGTAVVQDTAASGRRARLLPAGRSVTVRLTAPATGSRLVLRVRTGGPGPVPVVTVDGHRVAGLLAPGRTWRDQGSGAGHSGGAHTVTITNPPVAGRPDLLVDRVGFVPAQARALTPPAVDGPEEARIVQLVNAARAAAGLPRLAVSACADRFAEDWSATMARTSVLEHRPGLGTVMTACRASGAGENIAFGTVSPDQMMAMWMGSPGHRANILSRRFTHIGVAVSSTPAGRRYGTQNFLTSPR